MIGHEEQAFDALTTWAQLRHDLPSNALVELLSSLRYATMAADFLRYTVATHALLRVCGDERWVIAEVVLQIAQTKRRGARMPHRRGGGWAARGSARECALGPVHPRKRRRQQAVNGEESRGVRMPH